MAPWNKAPVGSYDGCKRIEASDFVWGYNRYGRMGTTQNAFVGGSPNLWSYVILDAYVLLVILLENQKTGSYPQRSHKGSWSLVGNRTCCKYRHARRTLWYPGSKTAYYNRRLPSMRNIDNPPWFVRFCCMEIHNRLSYGRSNDVRPPTHDDLAGVRCFCRTDRFGNIPERRLHISRRSYR